MTLLELETLPRLVPDGYYDSFEEAYEESLRRKASPPTDDAVTRVAKSRYGGYVVFTVSMALALEMFTDPALRTRPTSRSY